MSRFWMVVMVGLLLLAPARAGELPTFSLAWSEYPSWSVFGVADAYKLIDGKKGQLGPIEKKWGVDIELKEADYDTCLVMYGAGKCDAVCMTNMDALNPSLTIRSRAILPTSTSAGADACLVTAEIKSVADLKGKKVYGLAKTVSEYCFARNLELLGEKEADYAFTNMDPAAAAVAMQQKRAGFEGIVVWNPFVLETLGKRQDCRVLFDSTKIPNEIIDMVVMSDASLQKPGGAEFACAVIDAFYQINAQLADPKTADETLLAIGEKFSNLKLAQMKTVVEQTKFYATPEAALRMLSQEQSEGIMKKVVAFCLSHDIVSKEPAVAYSVDGAAPAQANLIFDGSLLKKYTGGK